MTKTLTLPIIILLAVTLLQVFGFSRLTLLGVSPDAVTVFLAFMSVFTGQRKGMTFGFAAGFLAGALSGNMGIVLLTRTIEGFTAGYCHVPENSHATMTQKSRMLYLGVVLASFTGNLVFSLAKNPLGEPLLYRVFVSGALACMMNLLLTIAIYRLFLRKTLSE
ncbi:rod shape-determining protein MreD [Chlorobium sp.]|uniref:rod shape-determining protein MreD n=1 Tax=Chlorobium sp. TaxID=1095 RepID=UPI003C33DA9E|nr:rod shape-determining protein MreD [Chlorobiaceae bacterium]NTW93909.1 rod shape-determining protein MreD [Chlorobiaceae bacterium]